MPLPVPLGTRPHSGQASEGPGSSQGATAAVPPESRHPTNRASPPRKVRKSEEEKEERNYGSSRGSLEQEGNQINK